MSHAGTRDSSSNDVAFILDGTLVSLLGDLSGREMPDGSELGGFRVYLRSSVGNLTSMKLFLHASNSRSLSPGTCPSALISIQNARAVL